MTKILMDDRNLSIENELLIAIEDYWGFCLPKDYRDFLIEFNGGVPKNRVFKFKNSEYGSIISVFSGLYKSSTDNLLKECMDMGKRYPKECFPIANDVVGNRICLVVKGRERGKIYFWDHELEYECEEGESPDYSNMTLIADSFQEFIDKLTSEEDL